MRKLLLSPLDLDERSDSTHRDANIHRTVNVLIHIPSDRNRILIQISLSFDIHLSVLNYLQNEYSIEMQLITIVDYYYVMLTDDEYQYLIMFVF